MRPLIAALALLTATTLQAAITATILDEEGKPLVGARVRAFSREENGALRKRLLSKEPETPAIVTASTKGEPVVLLVADAAGRAVQLSDAVDGRDAGSFVLPKAALLKGHIKDGGKPVANVLVVAGQWYLTHTDAGGDYDVPSLAGGFERLFFIHPDHAVAELTISATDSRRKSAYDVSLSKGVAIKGRVLAAPGDALGPHAVVSVAGWPLAESDESGSFSISHAPQSWRAVFARAPHFVGVAMNRGGTKPADIKLAPALTLSGTVKSATTTVAGSYVSLFSELDPGPPGAVSNSKGRFTIDGLLAGRYILFGTHPDFNVNRTPLDLSASGDRTVTATALVPVIGHVVDEAHKPVAAARVTVNASIPGGASMPRPATTSAAGEFTTRIFPDSNVQFAVFKPGYAAGVVGPLTAEKARNVTITLPAGFPATIRVIDRQHNPVAGALVEIVRATDNPGDRRTPLPCTEVRDDCRTTKADGTLAERRGREIRPSGERGRAGPKTRVGPTSVSPRGYSDHDRRTRCSGQRSRDAERRHSRRRSRRHGPRFHSPQRRRCARRHIHAQGSGGWTGVHHRFHVRHDAADEQRAHRRHRAGEGRGAADPDAHVDLRPRHREVGRPADHRLSGHGFVR